MKSWVLIREVRVQSWPKDIWLCCTWISLLITETVFLFPPKMHVSASSSFWWKWNHYLLDFKVVRGQNEQTSSKASGKFSFTEWSMWICRCAKWQKSVELFVFCSYTWAFCFIIFPCYSWYMLFTSFRHHCLTHWIWYYLTVCFNLASTHLWVKCLLFEKMT